jgi:hypothetical protein
MKMNSPDAMSRTALTVSQPAKPFAAAGGSPGIPNPPAAARGCTRKRAPKKMMPAPIRPAPHQAMLASMAVLLFVCARRCRKDMHSAARH